MNIKTTSFFPFYRAVKAPSTRDEVSFFLFFFFFSLNGTVIYRIVKLAL